MKILALETSGMTGEVALLEDNQVLVSEMLNEQQRTAQSLAPGIASALAKADWRPQDIDLVAVTIGPGSFTGLRVGVTTAKTFAYAVGCEVLGVDTLEVIAQQAPVPAETLWAVLDAQRSQLFAAQFEPAAGAWRMTAPAEIIDNDNFLAHAAGAMVTGSGLKRLVSQLEPACVVSPELWPPRAATVGQIAWRAYQTGRRDDLWTLSPRYLRASAAEEKAAQSE